MDDIIINKVAQSALETIDLENFYPSADVVTFDLKEYLFMGLILKEKDYRDTLKNLDWTQYENKIVAITCSADAIIPLWAYMLAVSYLQPFAQEVFFGKQEQVLEDLLLKNISQINPEDFRDKRVVVKGCGDKQIPESAFVEITKKLRPVVKSIMYGEPCSTVPIYKRK